MDAFFFMLVMIKHYEKWDKFATTYEVKKTAVTSSINKTLKQTVKPLVEELVKPLFKNEQVNNEIGLKDYPEVGLIVDVTFQTRTRPKMLFKEAQFYFSGKHHSYGLKTETAHLPNGQVAFISETYGGSVHDFTIFKDNVEIYKEFLQKKGQDNKIKDVGELKEKYPKMWALMADKGYQGASELLRAILPEKGDELTEEDKVRNKKIAKNRIICENFYGRMKKLFKIMEEKFRWDEEMYPIVFKVCVALTNYHISKYPLRAEDGVYYNAILKKYAEESLEKKRKQKENYLKSKRARLSDLNDE